MCFWKIFFKAQSKLKLFETPQPSCSSKFTWIETWIFLKLVTLWNIPKKFPIKIYSQKCPQNPFSIIFRLVINSRKFLDISNLRVMLKLKVKQKVTNFGHLGWKFKILYKPSKNISIHNNRVSFNYTYFFQTRCNEINVY